MTIETPVQEPTVPNAFLGLFTLENILWLTLAIVALGLRWVSLSTLPLSEGESALAYEAWRVAHGAAADFTTAGVNPFALNLTSLLFFLFGASDAMARVGATIGGVGLVLSPWLLRPLLGRGHALGMSALLLLSPSVWFFSRDASGLIWGALFAVLLIAFVARWVTFGAWWDGLAAAATFGIGLTTNGGFWSVLVAALIFGLVLRRRGLAIPRPTTAQIVVAVATFALIATGFGTNLAGLGAAFNQPIQWVIRLFMTTPSLVLPFFFTFALYEVLVLIVGIVGGVRLLDEKPLWAWFAFLWLGIALLPAALFNTGWAGALPYIVLPLTLLGGQLISRLSKTLLSEGQWRIDGLAVVVGLLLFFYFWLNFNIYLNFADNIKLFSLFIPLIGGILGLTYLYTIYSPAVAWRAGGTALLLLLVIITLSNGWGVSVMRANDPREPLVVQPSDNNLRTAAAQLASISIERYRDPAAIPLAIERGLGYAPRWYFRNFRTITDVDGSTSLPESALLRADSQIPAGIGQKVYVGMDWQWSIADSTGFLKWLKTRNDNNGLTNREAILYVSIP